MTGEFMEDKSALPDRLFSGLDGTQNIRSPEERPGNAGGDDDVSQQGSGLTGIMDMSDPLKDVYLALLKEGDMSMQEIRENPVFEEIEDREALPVYVKILARQGYLEKYRDGDVIKYRALTGDRGKRTVSDDIWDALR